MRKESAIMINIGKAISVPSGVSRPTPGEPRNPERPAPPVSPQKRGLARSIRDSRTTR